MINEIGSLLETKLTGITLIGGVNVGVLIISPNDTNPMTYPCIGIRLSDIRQNTARKRAGNVYASVDDVNHTAMKKVFPEPYDLYFQVETYTENVGEEWELLDNVLRKLPFSGYLTLGSDRLRYSKTDFLTIDDAASPTISKKLITYRIEAWLDSTTVEEVKLAKEVTVETGITVDFETEEETESYVEDFTG